MSGTTALICFLYPSSDEAKDKILTLLKSAAVSYYSTSKSLCTTWNYFSPSQRPKAPFQPLSPSFSLSPCSSTSSVPLPLVVGGVEIYTSVEGLNIQQKEPMFNEFLDKVKKEDLYARDEELSVWHPRGGFASRESRSTEPGFPLLAMFRAKDEAGREACVKVLAKFCDWVRANEPGVLTYTVMTRPDSKKSTEVVMYERYKDMASFKSHGSSKEFKAMFKGLLPYINPKQTKMAEWEEIKESFTGTEVGGEGKARL